MDDSKKKQRLIDLLTTGLLLADEIGDMEVALHIDAALHVLDPSNPVLRDSAERLWRLPD